MLNPKPKEKRKERKTMTNAEINAYAGRLAKAIESIGYARLLMLPEQIKVTLQNTQDLALKVRMLENIADQVKRGKA